MLKLIRSLAIISWLSLCAGFPVHAQTQNTSSGVAVTTTVTALGKNFSAPPPIAKQDVIAYSGKSRLDVLRWVPGQSSRSGLQLAIVIDNSANTSEVGSQLHDLAAFIVSQPKNTAVGVFYAMNGTVQTAAPFSTDHNAVAKGLRLPFGARAGDSPSVYLSVSELVKKHWPVTGGRREVLLISSGIDRLDAGPQSPYVAAAVEDVEKAGVTVHTIYTGTSIRFGESLRGQFAQANLEQLTDASGGYSFFQGLTAPVSFAPYLQELNMVLRNQYLLTFNIEPSNKEKGELRDLKVSTEQRGVELKYPKQVFVPGQHK